MDLDVFLWISPLENDITTVQNITSNQLTVSCFPFGGPNILDGVYTFYFHEQVSYDFYCCTDRGLIPILMYSKRKLASLGLINNLAASLVNGKAAPWYGDILVIKQDKLRNGVVDVIAMDVPVISRIVRRYVSPFLAPNPFLMSL